MALSERCKRELYNMQGPPPPTGGHWGSLGGLSYTGAVIRAVHVLSHWGILFCLDCWR